MSEGPILTNGNIINNGNGIGGDISTSHQPVSVSFPETRDQLSTLLHKYQQLMKTSNEAKEKHDNFVRYLENKENGVGDFKGPSNDVKPVFKDPTEEERLAIENVFYKISEQYQQFVKNEEAFYDSIKEHKSEESLDLELLEKQIAGLQFLSKDLDLPESLQEDYESVINSESESARNNDTDRFIEAFLNSKSNLNDFMKRAESLGIKVPQPLGSLIRLPLALSIQCMRLLVIIIPSK